MILRDELLHPWNTDDKHLVKNLVGATKKSTYPARQKIIPANHEESPQIQGAFNLITLSKFPLKKTPLIDEVKKTVKPMYL